MNLYNPPYTPPLHATYAYIYTRHARIAGIGMPIKTPHEHLPLLCSGQHLEVCEVSRRQEQSAKVNAFLCIATLFPSHAVIGQEQSTFRLTRREQVVSLSMRNPTERHPRLFSVIRDYENRHKDNIF